MLDSLILDHLIVAISPALSTNKNLPFLGLKKHTQYILFNFRPVAGECTITNLGTERELGNCPYTGSSIVKICRSKVTLSKFFELICASGAALCHFCIPCEMKEHLHELDQKSLPRTNLCFYKCCKNVSVQGYLLPQHVSKAVGNSSCKNFQKFWLSVFVLNSFLIFCFVLSASFKLIYLFATQDISDIMFPIE